MPLLCKIAGHKLHKVAAFYYWLNTCERCGTELMDDHYDRQRNNRLAQSLSHGTK